MICPNNHVPTHWQFVTGGQDSAAASQQQYYSQAWQAYSQQQQQHYGQQNEAWQAYLASARQAGWVPGQPLAGPNAVEEEHQAEGLPPGMEDDAPGCAPEAEARSIQKVMEVWKVPLPVLLPVAQGDAGGKMSEEPASALANREGAEHQSEHRAVARSTSPPDPPVVGPGPSPIDPYGANDGPAAADSTHNRHSKTEMGCTSPLDPLVRADSGQGDSGDCEDFIPINTSNSE